MRYTISGEIPVRYHIGDNNAKILNRLGDEIEGVCGSSGFILPGTTRMISRSAPFLDRNENGGITRVLVRYEADTILIEREDILSVKIESVNRIGAKATYSIEDNVIAYVLLPTDLQDSNTMTQNFNVDHIVDVKVLDLQFGVGWDHIAVVGKLVEQPVKKHTEIDDITNAIETSSKEW
jgi:hypothetical protein